eukprot:6208839-Pleurochrysis_carterae.AAC.1
MKARVRLRQNQQFTGIGGVGQAWMRISPARGHHMNLGFCVDVAFIIVNKGSANPFASRCAQALAPVALCILRKNIRFSGKRVAN